MWLDRVVRFPLTKIVLGTAAVFGALLATRALIEWLYELLDLVRVRFFSIPAVAAAILAVRWRMPGTSASRFAIALARRWL